MAGFGTNAVLRNGEHRRALTAVSHLLCQEEDSRMTRRDQELLDKQLWGVSSRSPQNGMTILMIVAVFLAGIGIGDVVSKTKQANTHYAALISYPNGQE
jgi:L-alanine-DL-glutamate epimerase-like enolase superfamily enzyme